VILNRQNQRYARFSLIFRSNPQAITDQQHADHQLGIDRGSPGVAVICGQVLAKVGEIEETIDGSQKVILRDEVFEIKCVEQLVLRLNTRVLSHQSIFEPSW
jgi:hypothetical protein